MNEYKLKNLREEQRKYVEMCKSEPSFRKKRELVEKFEEEEKKSSYFSNVKSKKYTGFDRFSGFILTPDPSKSNALICTACGEHNGLIDPKNSNVDYFHCYSCKYKNVRNNVIENKKEK
ncbi:hypothetical protein HERIO_1851 [Hepatospora eriocheir]|uniref:Lunapark zinc ribbon domain-containing protein n=1 Tax=Hepatospora eriocheir TaxID=1081669 RepID=A0A1X0Q8W2_9MICR|nr:hypothetical protein HERIO_1851 [Hepatospora eriocheir]